ncbi:MAG: DNA polymerase III subunit alpha, partial [Bacteroidetes bacterium]|nr:DNA polymerase III subunit alpha [Bacteroidota bacterium]
DSQTLLKDNFNKTFKVAGLVVDAQHRTTKTNRAFGILKIEDFTGNVEFALFGEKFQRLQHYFEKGKSLLVQGIVKKGWKKEGDTEDKFEFDVTDIYLLETVKSKLTKNIELNMHASSVDENMIAFIQKNMKTNPGSVSLKFNIVEPLENLKITLSLFDKGVSMNEELAEYLLKNEDVEVSVGLN